MNNLVVYYSRSGNTERVAQIIASQLNAEVEAVRDRRNRRGVWGYMRSGLEAWRGQLAPIDSPGKDPSAYDVVAVGTPIWAGRMSSPVRSYLTAQAGKFPRLAVFCVSSSGGNSGALAEMAAVAKAEPVAQLELTGAQARSGDLLNFVSDFVTSLGG
ncbi:MAG: flavodoxin family protein [Candidatus Bipolaricaulaceae bacterium]